MVSLKLATLALAAFRAVKAQINLPDGIEVKDTLP
jgi:hypothetical protein